MVAPPPVRGSRTNEKWRLGVAVYVLALEVGAISTGMLLFAASRAVGVLNMRLMGIACFVLALMAILVLAKKLEPASLGSRWRVPQRWGRFGHLTYSALFGLAVGTGVLTALSSLGLCGLLLWGVSAPTLQVLWPPFLAFGLGRAVPLIATLLTNKCGAREYVCVVDGLGHSVRPLVVGEGVLLALTSITLTLPS